MLAFATGLERIRLIWQTDCMKRTAPAFWAVNERRGNHSLKAKITRAFDCQHRLRDKGVVNRHVDVFF
jgi:hypothetical protein